MSAPLRAWYSHVSAAVALAATAAGAGAQTTVPDHYWVAGEEVPLTVHLDSFAVVTETPRTGEAVAGIVEGYLPGADSVRQLSPSMWIVRVNPNSRAALRAAVLGVEQSPSVRWAGFLVRTPNTRDPAIVTDEFIVKFAAGLSRASVDAINAQYGVRVVREPWSMHPNQFILRVTGNSKMDALAMANAYRDDPRVVYAHPNWMVPMEPQASWTPPDPKFAQQWHLFNPGVVNGGIRADIHAPEAWDLEKGKPTVTIAVLEVFGFDVDHEDLDDNLWRNPWEPSGVGDPFSKSGDVVGWNFEGCPSPPDPTTGLIPTPDVDSCGSSDLSADEGGAGGHATQVAGTAAAESNGKGGLGVCPGCTLMLIRMGSVYPFSTTRAEAIDYATAMGADVINYSNNAPYDDGAFEDAVVTAATQGRNGHGIPIAAAPPDKIGNFCTDAPGGGILRSLANQDEALSVADTDDHDKRGGALSTLRPVGSCLDLVAPGRTFLTTLPSPTHDQYGPVTGGTSFAAPVVAGVMGLMLSKNPDLDRASVYKILEESADKIGGVTYDAAGHNDEYGFGRVNAYQALLNTPAVTTNQLVCDPNDETCPPVEQALPWELGLRFGVSRLVGTVTQNEFDAPGDGPLSEPVLYATWFPTGVPLLLDLQAGYNKRWGGTGATDESRLAVGASVAARVEFGCPMSYGGVTVARRSVDAATASSSATGVGLVLGCRWTAGSKLATRIEGRWRWWSSLSLNEWGLAVGVGVQLP